MVDVGAAADVIRTHESEIERALLVEFAVLLSVQEGEEQVLNFQAGERVGAGGRDGSVQAQGDGRAGDKKYVGSVALGGEGKDLLKVGARGGEGLQNGPRVPGQVRNALGGVAVVAPRDVLPPSLSRPGPS